MWVKYALFSSRFGWDFPTGPDFVDFDPLTLNFNILDTQNAHPYAHPYANSMSFGQSLLIDTMIMLTMYYRKSKSR